MRLFMLILCVLPCLANAAYERNVARPVEKIVFGKIESVRYFSQHQFVEAKTNGWETFAGAVAGGVIGHQFGSGHGRTWATVIGSIAGAGIANSQSASRPYHRDDPLVELLIAPSNKNEKLIDVIQDVDPNMLFNRGDSVRLLYFSDGVRVDKEY
ncbi:glycine zipper 2TM domain-containing protein [Vibrio sp. PP-XX7]